MSPKNTADAACKPNQCEYIVTDMASSGKGVHGLKALYRVECKHCGHARTGTADEIPTAKFQ